MKHRTLNWLFVGWFRPYTNGMGYFLKLVWVFPCPSHHPQQIPEKAVKSHFTLGVKIKSFLHHLSHLHSNYGWIRACHTLRGGVPKFSLEKCGMSIYCSYVGSGLGIVLRWDAVITAHVVGEKWGIWGYTRRVRNVFESTMHTASRPDLNR